MKGPVKLFHPKLTHPEKLKIACRWVLSFNCVVTLEFHYCTCMASPKPMSPYWEWLAKQHPCSVGLQALQLSVSGSHICKRLSTWAKENWYNEKDFSRLSWWSPYNSSNSAFSLSKALCDFCNFREHTLCVFLLPWLKWVWWNTASYSPLYQIYFLIQAKLFPCAPQLDV